MDSMEDFWTVREMLWTVWKITGYSRIFPDSMEDFGTVLTISGQLESLDSLENVTDSL